MNVPSMAINEGVRSLFEEPVCNLSLRSQKDSRPPLLNGPKPRKQPAEFALLIENWQDHVIPARSESIRAVGRRSNRK